MELHTLGREAAKRTTPPCIFEVCTDERGYGPVRVQAPCLTRLDDGQGREVGTSSTTRSCSGASHQAAGTEYFSLDVEDMTAAGSRPDRLAGVRPQVRVQRHTVEHIVDFVRVAPMVQFVDALVPLMVGQLPDIMHFSTRSRLTPNRLSKCPRSCLTYANRCSRYAAGGTAGGSADDRILFLVAADYGAERRHSSSWSWRAKRWSSRFSSQREFNSADCRADLCQSWSRWRSPRFSPRTEFILLLALSSWCSWRPG